MGVEVAAGLAGGAAAEARATSGHLRNSARLLVRPVAFGLMASLGLSLFYLGIITLAQSWEHAFTQLGEDLQFVAALVLGFGLQVGLLTYLHALEVGARKAGVAASGGASGVAMLACCAHHVSDVLPVVGLSGAAAFLGAYKTPMLWLSVLVNLAGVIYLIWRVAGVTRSGVAKASIQATGKDG